MAYQCSCRALNDTTINQRLETVDPTKEVDHKLLSEHCGGDRNFDNPGGYNCGRCKPYFSEKAKQINEAREIREEAFKLPQNSPACLGIKEPA